MLSYRRREKLFSAAQEGRLANVRHWLTRGYLYEPPDVNVCDENGWTALHLAACEGHVSVVRELIGVYGANVDARTKNRGETPLIWATFYGRVDVAKALIDEYQADIFATSEEGWNPFLVACARGHVELVAHVLSKFKDGDEKVSVVNRSDSQNRLFPLRCCSKEGHVDVARLLLDEGADVSHSSNEGETPLHSASRSGHVSVVGLLISLGQADVNRRNNERRTALHVGTKHANVVRELINHGAAMEVTDRYGQTPLILASGKGHLDAVNVLVEKGAAIDAREMWRGTPLHWACAGGQPEVVRTLLRRGANMRAIMKKGTTPLELAQNVKKARQATWSEERCKRQEEVIRILERVAFLNDTYALVLEAAETRLRNIRMLLGLPMDS